MFMHEMKLFVFSINKYAHMRNKEGMYVFMCVCMCMYCYVCVLCMYMYIYIYT